MADSYIIALSVFSGFLIMGLISQWVVLKYVVRIVRSTRFKWDDILINTVRAYLFLWFLLMGIKAAVPFLELPSGMNNFIGKAVIVLLITTFSLALIKMVSGFTDYYSHRSGGKLQSTTIFVNLLKIGILIIGLLLIFQSLGIKITPLITALGVGGLAVALALQDTLANLFSGLHIIFAGQIRVGDFVKLDTGQKGKVIDITWKNCSIRTRGNNIVLIPNSKMSQAIVINYNLDEKRMLVRIPVGVAYDSDLEEVERVTLEVAKETVDSVEGGVSEYEPKVRFHTFNDSSIDMVVLMQAKDYMSQYLVKHEFVKRLHSRYNKEGIVIPFPIRTVEMKKNKEGK